MTTNFTLRDFFVYLLVGLTLIICLGSLFTSEIIKLTVNVFSTYDFIKDFSFLVTILLIPTIYLFGHIIGSISYNLLQLYVYLDKGYFKRPISKRKYSILMKLQQLLYKQRVVFAIINYTKTDKTEKLFKNVGEFWRICAELQIEKIYAPAEYWYVLNELFNSLNIIFFISTIVAFLTQHWILGVVYFILTIFAFKRAKQYAEHFIQTVCNLTIAMQKKQQKK